MDEIKSFLESTGGTTIFNSIPSTDSTKETWGDNPVNVITLHEINENDETAFVVTYYGDWAYIDKVMQQEKLIK